MPTQDTGNGQQPAGQQSIGGEPPASPSVETTAQTWDDWLASRPDAERPTITALYERQTQGLRSALDKERDDRKALEKQVRDLAKAAEKGSDAETQLTTLADQLAAADRRADFYRDAAKTDVGIADPELAWLRVNASPDEFFDRKGNVNFTLLKERHPALFVQTPLKPATPKGNAGSGAGQQGAGALSMTDFIRQQAGRR